MYLSGAAVSASYGIPDIGLLSLDHFVNKIKEISLSSGLPFIADADTGFGEAEMCHRIVLEYFMAGASGNIKRSSYRRLSVS
jgi:methylisocitrate lyase